MNQRADIPMTVEGKEALEAELHQLTRVEREKVTTQIAEARALGDLKENSEYHAAKEKQSLLEGRILEIQGKLSRARVVDPSTLKVNNIVFGATVTLFDPEKDKTIIYQIVGEDEADITKGKISYLSPLGKSLIGKEEGDSVTVKAPKGDIEYDIECVEYK